MGFKPYGADGEICELRSWPGLRSRALAFGSGSDRLRSGGMIGYSGAIGLGQAKKLSEGFVVTRAQ